MFSLYDLIRILFFNLSFVLYLIFTILSSPFDGNYKGRNELTWKTINPTLELVLPPSTSVTSLICVFPFLVAPPICVLPIWWILCNLIWTGEDPQSRFEIFECISTKRFCKNIYNLFLSSNIFHFNSLL